MRKHMFMLLTAIAVLCAFITTAPKAEAATVTALTADVSIETIGRDTVLDLNGYSITTLNIGTGVTVTIRDSQTDDYDSANGRTYGKITNITGGGTVVADAGYLLVRESGGTSVHKVELKVSGAVLRITNLEDDGAGMYYQCTFGGDTQVKDNIVAYGVALGANKMPEFLEKTYTRKTDLGAAWQTGTAFVNNSGLLKGIMKIGNTDDVNIRNSSMDVYCQAYVELADGSRIVGECAKFSLQDLVEGTGTMLSVEREFSNLRPEEKTAVQNFYGKFENVVQTWSIPQIRQAVDGGVYEIRSAKELYVLGAKPDGQHKLVNDLDMTGVDWTSVGMFTGTFDGNSHTIRNLTVRPESGNYIGMFTEIDTAGKVCDLNLENITVDATGTGARFVGTIAGYHSGTIENCTVTGAIHHDNPGSSTAYTFIGALVGRAMKDSVTTGGTGLSVKRTAKDMFGETDTYTTEGLAAQIRMNVPDTDFVMRRLVGNYPTIKDPETDKTVIDCTISGIWQDLSFSTQYEDAELQRRRQVVVNDVYEQGTIKWTPATTIRYYHDQKNLSSMYSWSSKYHIHNMTFTKGKTYIGIPYTHCASSLEQAKYYMTKGADGVYTLKSDITQIKGGSDNSTGASTWSNGDIGWGKYLGSDCSGSLTTAWHKVSPILTSEKSNGGVCLFYTENMVPSQYNQWYYGFQQVGNYKVDDEKWTTWDVVGDAVTAGGVTMKNYNLTTEDIFLQIGKNGFYEAYARSQMGDIAVAYEKEPDAQNAKVGHARLIAQDPVVIRNANGGVDPSKSYFLFHEQGAGLHDASVNSSWRINWYCSFAEAAMQLANQTYGGNSNGYYLPITMDAFHDTKVAASGGLASGGNTITGNDPLRWVLNSSYRIQYATMVITDAQNKVVYEKTAFQGTSSNQGRRRGVPGAIPVAASDLFSDSVNDLVAGQTYYATFSGTTFSGITDVKMNNYKFTYDPAA